MAIIAINYEYNATKLDIIAENRPAHRAHLKESGALLASGPLGTNGALLVVVADDPEAGLEVLAQDPFFTLGVIETRIARVWNPVIGPWQ